MNLLIRKNDDKDYEIVVNGDREEPFSYVELIKAIYNEIDINLEFENIEEDMVKEIENLFMEFKNAGKADMTDTTESLPF